MLNTEAPVQSLFFMASEGMKEGWKGAHFSPCKFALWTS